MLKYFRRIRQKLIEKGSAKRYFFYAVGEIILVVIGILIAVQINNWNENRKDRILEKEYLIRLQEDLKFNQSWLKIYILDRYKKKIEGLEKGKAYFQGNYSIKDTLKFLLDVRYGGVYGNGDWNLNTNTYNELISTGSLTKIRNDALRTDITDYYETLGANQKSSKNYVSGYINYTNSLASFDVNNPDFISEFDKNLLLKNLKSEEYYRLANLELTLAHRISKFAKNSIELSEALISKIEKQLKE